MRDKKKTWIAAGVTAGVTTALFHHQSQKDEEAQETDGTGVSVSALCPGPTKTNWAANAGKADSKIAKDPAEVAEAGFIGMQQGQLIIIPDADYRAVRLLMRPLPAKLQAIAIALWQKRLIAKK